MSALRAAAVVVSGASTLVVMKSPEGSCEEKATGVAQNQNFISAHTAALCSRLMAASAAT
jgi:hypothetical protein